MPIYEYGATGEPCKYCGNGFEVIQKIDDEPLSRCPACGAPVGRLPSRFHACVLETDDEVAGTERKVREFEKKGMWSHAAEIADKAGIEDRAKDDYKKAGYDM